MPCPPVNVIVHSTDRNLDKTTESILTRGLDYAVTPNKVPVEDFVIHAEAAIKTLPPEQSEHIRQETARILRKSKPPAPNITPAQRQALKDLKNDNEILVLPADKGNATVIM